MQEPKYGSPCVEAHVHACQDTFLDILFLSASKDEIPAAGSEKVKEELQQVKRMCDQLQTDQPLQLRYKLYDKSLQNYFSNFSFINDDHANTVYRDIVKNIFKDIWPLIYKLKMHYQRQRPWQLGELHDIKIYPTASLTSHCPSYPSMHSCAAFVLLGVCGSKFQSYYQTFFDLANDVCQSRLYMGVCLPSDIEAGKRLAHLIIAEKEFQLKYGL